MENGAAKTRRCRSPRRYFASAKKLIHHRDFFTTETQRHREMQAGQARDPRTAEIIAAAIEVHRHLGPGLLQTAYEECLCHELHLRVIQFRPQVPLPLDYKAVQW